MPSSGVARTARFIYEKKCDSKPVALALDAAGNHAVVAFADGHLSAFAPACDLTGVPLDLGSGMVYPF